MFYEISGYENLEQLFAKYPAAYAVAECGQDEVDLSEPIHLSTALAGGDVLVWASEEDAEGDNGAEAVARIAAVRCECGEVTGVPCVAVAEVELDVMPKHLRESHGAAGNAGEWPANGAMRLRVSAPCAESLIESEGSEWARSR